MGMLHNLIGAFVKSQVLLSKWFDKLLPAKFHVDEYQDFVQSVIPKYFKKAGLIHDIGGGKRPYITADLKQLLCVTVVGLDIDESELKAAPEGIYDKLIVVDITKYKGDEEADLALCLALLEHVRNVEAALQGIASCLKRGGLACIFVPSGNALYARINKMLPESVKRKILFFLFPHRQETQAFPAYYDRCTPRDIKFIAGNLGFEVVEERCYYISAYFSFFFPLYFVWRLNQLVFYAIGKEQAAETFGMVLRKAK